MSRFLIRLLGAAPPVGDVVPDADLLRRYADTGDAAPVGGGGGAVEGENPAEAVT